MSGWDDGGPADRIVPAIVAALVAPELPPFSLTALEYAWSVERDDGGLALWMVTSSLERNRIELASLRPIVAGSVLGDERDGDESEGRGHGSLSRVAGSPSEDAPATHRPL